MPVECARHTWRSWGVYAPKQLNRAVHNESLASYACGQSTCNDRHAHASGPCGMSLDHAHAQLKYIGAFIMRAGRVHRHRRSQKGNDTAGSLGTAERCTTSFKDCVRARGTAVFTRSPSNVQSHHTRCHGAQWVNGPAHLQARAVYAPALPTELVEMGERAF